MQEPLPLLRHTDTETDLRTFLSIILENYQRSRVNAEQLKSLQDWIRSIK